MGSKRPDFRDAGVLSEVFREHSRRVFLVANSVLRDDAAAEEVVQDVFMQLWRKPGQFDPQRASLGTFVTLLARRRALDAWRARRAQQAAVERSAGEQRVTSAAADHSAAQPVIERERARAAVSALRVLPAEQRRAVVMAYGGGMTAREIARATGVPLGTAKSRLRLGLERARMQLEAA